MKKKSFLSFFALFFVLTASAYSQGIVFKIPDGVFPMDWNKSGFKGVLMLEKDSPSGVFIASPNNDESIDQLRERAAIFLAPMVSDAPKDKSTLPFDIRNISKNEGDLEEGKYYHFKGEKSSVQILFHIREANGTKFLYGYFAGMGNDEKKKSRWADDDGKGVNIFKKFVSSFKT